MNCAVQIPPIFLKKVSTDGTFEHRLIERQIFVDETSRRKKTSNRVTNINRVTKTNIALSLPSMLPCTDSAQLFTYLAKHATMKCCFRIRQNILFILNQKGTLYRTSEYTKQAELQVSSLYSNSNTT